MNVLGIRFCSVNAHAEQLARLLGDGLGLPRKDLDDDADGFSGAIFPAGESWIEIWPESEDMPSGVMLQIVVDDADAWAAQARSNGLEPHGPTDAHGERMYFIQGPGGLPITFQSKRVEVVS